jgi:hypothetical protein
MSATSLGHGSSPAARITAPWGVWTRKGAALARNAHVAHLRQVVIVAEGGVALHGVRVQVAVQARDVRARAQEIRAFFDRSDDVFFQRLQQ